MGFSQFGPGSHIDLDEFERRLRESGQRAGPSDVPSKLADIAKSSTQLPHPLPSRCAPNTRERVSTVTNSTEPIDVRTPPQLHLTPGNETSIFDAEDPRALDVDDFRRWWRQSSDPGGGARAFPWTETDAYGDRICRDRASHFRTRAQGRSAYTTEDATPLAPRPRHCQGAES